MPKTVASPKCHVYAVELEDGTIYVGSTCKTVRERVSEHKEQRGKARLRKDLCGARYALSREKAEEMERALAARLRKQGYRVEQG